ncbi:MAG: phytoene/squalene synthase family protein [Thermoflexales bacterium]|nr:phytoene/squalene synthase family protein [Thermoflexales bacterium]
MNIAAWEHPLIERAIAALSSPVPAFRADASYATLASAQAYCEAITRQASRTFHLAASLLPAAKRRAVHALYAFCRVTDDLIDRPGDPADIDLRFEHWRARAASPAPAAGDPVLMAWADAQTRFGIPIGLSVQLIEGVARDRAGAHYETFEHLTTYCYGVASTVGLMAMQIIGFDSPDALPHAIKLGVALQMTNILRDVGEDWRAGRVYLPRQELREYGLDVETLNTAVGSSAWRDFMRFQIARTRALYAESGRGLAYLTRDGRTAVAAASGLYSAILERIEANEFDVFGLRASVSAADKLRRLPGLWWRAQRL